MFTGSLSTTALEKALSATSKRMQLIAHNIANEDTPGYKAQRVEFEELLKRELRGVSYMKRSVFEGDTAKRVASLQPVVYSDESTEVRIDGNNVNIDSEEIEMARVQLQYTALQQRISGHYNQMKYAISGGR